MSEGVLGEYARLMETDHTIFRYDETGQWLELLESLAAEVRALRTERADAMSYFLDPNSPGSPPKYTDDYGPTLLNQIQGLAGYYEEMMDEDRAEVKRLKARLAELEPDAKLGKMVREMPEGHCIAHSNSDSTDCAWYYGFLVKIHLLGFGPTPEAALEAALKEETCTNTGE